jgi:hypothetical protein
MSFNVKSGTARDSRGHFRPLTKWERAEVARYRARALKRAEYEAQQQREVVSLADARLRAASRLAG